MKKNVLVKKISKIENKMWNKRSIIYTIEESEFESNKNSSKEA